MFIVIIIIEYMSTVCVEKQNINRTAVIPKLKKVKIKQFTIELNNVKLLYECLLLLNQIFLF